tara:strand:+ start:41 stop:742 length:702 start_codon:yes stop_codon:yes gene_type:complete
MNNNTQNINSFLATLLLNYPSPSLTQTDLSNNNIPTTDLSNNDLFSLIDMIHDSLPVMNTTQPSNIQNLLQTTLNQKNCYKNVLSEEGKQEIKFLTYKKEDFEKTKCPIMQVPFEEGEIIAQLPCGHIFNKDSVLQWLEEESNKCPVCRYELKFKEEKNNIETHTNHPYGPRNRRIGFTNFLNNYYEAQEDRMIQRAIEQSLLDLGDNQEDSDNETDTLLLESEIEVDIDDLI